MIMNYDWKDLLRQVNEELAQFGTEIKIVTNDRRRSDILIIKSDRDQPLTSAEGLREEDLYEFIMNARESANLLIARDAEKLAAREKLHTYREISDDEASLISKFTDYPLFFLLPDGTIESVKDASDGTFVIREKDYEPAMIQVEEHEEDT